MIFSLVDKLPTQYIITKSTPEKATITVLNQNLTLFQTNDERFKFMEVSMRALLELRGQAASGALPQDQLRRVARTAVFTIDKGNR